MSQLERYHGARALINDYRMRKRADFWSYAKQRASAVADYIKGIDWTSDRARRIYGALGGAGIGGVSGALLGGKKGAVLGALGGAGLGYGGMYYAYPWLRGKLSPSPAEAPLP